MAPITAGGMGHIGATRARRAAGSQRSRDPVGSHEAVGEEEQRCSWICSQLNDWRRSG
jgi:hypothetical protein